MKIESFKIEDDNVFIKNIRTFGRKLKALNITFHSHPISDEKCIKTKVKTFNGVINNLILSDNKIPKEKNHYICIAAINIDSLMKIDKKALLRFI